MKMDPKLLSDEPHELDRLVRKMKKKYQITTSREELRQLNAQYNNSREKIEEHLLAQDRR